MDLILQEKITEGNPVNDDGKEELASKITLIAVIAFAVFVVFLSVLLSRANMSDLQWNRYIYLLTGIETIVFTAIGWLFGKAVHRGEAQQAEKLVTETKEQARQRITALQKELQIVQEELSDVAGKSTDEQEKGHILYYAIQMLNSSHAKRVDNTLKALQGFYGHGRSSDTDDFTILRILIQGDDGLERLATLSEELYPELVER
jgi:hypothetical protein